MISQFSRLGTWLRPGPISVRRNRAFRPASVLGLDELESRVVPSVTLSVTAAPYYADPSGVADSSVAIQHCINDVSNAGGGTVFFPTGTYKISFAGAGRSPTAYDGLITMRSNVTLAGNGSANSVIRLANSQGEYFGIFNCGSNGSIANNATIQDLTIDQNGPNNQVPGGDSELSGEPRSVIWTFNSSNLTVQRCRFTNLLDAQAIRTTGPNVHGEMIANNTFDNVGGNSVDFDSSTVYTDCQSATISGNTFTSRYGPGTKGARTTIEIHGNNQTVTNNTISGFRCGMFAVDSNLGLGSNNQLYENNTLTDVGDGFMLWTFTSGLQNVTFRDNNITVNVNGWTGFFDGTGFHGFVAYSITASAAIDHVDFINNTITFTNYAGSSRPGDSYTSGFLLLSLGDSPTFTNLQILDNHVNSALGCGIDLDWPINGLTVTGNVITDPGSSPAPIDTEYRSAVRVVNTVQNATVQSS